MSYQLTTAKVWNGSGWVDAVGGDTSFLIDYLVVGGGGTGGGGNGWRGGGGGAGAYLCSVTGELSGGGVPALQKILSKPGDTFSVTVGAGGAQSTTDGSRGRPSQFGPIVAEGGGSGSRYNGANFTNGGSGAGAGDNHDSGKGDPLVAGRRGGYRNQGAGGGGGAGGVGVNGVTGYISGAGGPGLSSSITGSPVTRAAGGGGANLADNVPANSGNGSAGDQSNSVNGASGVVIIRYPATQSMSIDAGLTSSTTIVGDNKVTQFTAGTGTVTVL